MSELIVPGKWKCDKCEFVLIRNSLNARSGQISVDYEPISEPCPNHTDGTMLRAYTWKEEAKDGDKALERMLQECDSAGALMWSAIDAIDALLWPSARITDIRGRLLEHLEKHHVPRPLA